MCCLLKRLRPGSKFLISESALLNLLITWFSVGQKVQLQSPGAYELPRLRGAHKLLQSHTLDLLLLAVWRLP